MTASAATSLVEIEAGVEIVLVTSAALRHEIADLAQELLASGYDASVLVDAGDGTDISNQLHTIVGDALVVICHRGDVDLAAMRMRCDDAGVLCHAWLDGRIDESAVSLLGPILARVDTLTSEQLPPSGKFLDLAEVSNVVLLPAPPRLSANPPPHVPLETPPRLRARPQPRRGRSPWITGLVSAALTAMSAAIFWAIGTIPAQSDHEAVASAEAAVFEERSVDPESRVQPDPEPGGVAGPALKPAPEPEPEPAPEPERTSPQLGDARPDANDEPEAPSPIEATPPPQPLLDALADGRIREVDGLFVVDAHAGRRNWYQAMTWCRSRAFGGTKGWKTPRRAELLALAKARVLPAAPLWSRNRADDTGEVAFTVHGRSARLGRLDKTSTVEHLVCVLPRSAPI